MSVAGGELPKSLGPNARFFQQKQGAAFLKHAIIRRHYPKFAGKTGSTSEGHRVYVLDAYARQGSYDDGPPGSPAYAAETARRMVGKRNVICIYVEKDRKAYNNL